MTNISATLLQAYTMIENTNQTLCPEIVFIRDMLISPAYIEKFRNDTLYLKWIDTLIKERNNISFPEHPEEYICYINDCISLKEQMEPFSENIWLSCSVLLFENLKTPYYPIYANTMINLEKCFANHELFTRTLQSFYSVIIKSSPEKQKLIDKIAAQGSSYKNLLTEEDLLAKILLFQLSSFGQEKDFCLVSLFSQMYTDMIDSENEINQEAFLSNFQKKELDFISDWTKEQENVSLHPLTDTFSFQEYLTQRILWFQNHRCKAPQEILFHKSANKKRAHRLSDGILDKYAYNMTAAEYITNPAIGREQELRDLELILISPKKSPVLLGNAGVGKTSVAEGLAWKLQQGSVPNLLKDKQIYKLTTTSLLSGTKYVGEMEERLKQLMEELYRRPEVILFIDEIHTIVGAGSTESSHNDISNMLKPYIDRGEIKIIGSTTADEYEKYILSDRALARRFYPITIEEPDEETTLQILLGTLPSIEYKTNVKNNFPKEETIALLQQLIILSNRENQPEGFNTSLPELPLTLLEMAFSYAALESREFICKDDFTLALRHTNLLTKEVRAQLSPF